jgi:hypothetical protein
MPDPPVYAPTAKQAQIGGAGARVGPDHRRKKRRFANLRRAGWPWRLPARAPTDPGVRALTHPVLRPTGWPSRKGPRGYPSTLCGQVAKPRCAPPVSRARVYRPTFRFPPQGPPGRVHLLQRYYQSATTSCRPSRRKTRFQPLVRRYWTGSLPQGSNGRFQSASLHLILLPQALLGAITSTASVKSTDPSNVHSSLVDGPRSGPFFPWPSQWRTGGLARRNVVTPAGNTS